MFFKKKIVSNNKSLPVVWKLFNGTCYVVNNRSIYIKGEQAYKFYSPRCEASWRLDPVEVSFGPFIIKGTLGFRDGTVIQNAKDGKIYLISDAKRNLLTKPLGDYGFDWSMVVEASDDEVQFHAEGPES